MVSFSVCSCFTFTTTYHWFTTENLYGGRFHTHLRDTFAPQVIRYVDLMESTIAQSLHKHFEKEKWDTKGFVFS